MVDFELYVYIIYGFGEGLGVGLMVWIEKLMIWMDGVCLMWCGGGKVGRWLSINFM